MSDKDNNRTPDEEAAGTPKPGDGPEGTSDVDERFADIVGDVDVDEEGTTELSRESQLEALLAERTEDLQRLQAEYVNYKRRVDRDRDLSRQSGIEKVVSDLVPVLDSIAMARQHGELEGGFKLVADELAKVAEAHGLSSFGAVGEAFDPNLHEALMQLPMAGATVTSVSQVIQPGYRLGDRVLRPARVAVSDPDPDAATPTGSGDGEAGPTAEQEESGEAPEDQAPSSDDE